ncbi:AAA family ATPase [Argonema antarcticum A004/B2]|nr:ATP-binding sensor histidine kinase [Argonema antarcticum]MCL1472182.1 AAA family ATPase [Argonema antarcticum A004/B2]
MITLTGYEIFTQIYESANSLVYRGLRKQDNQPVILKFLKQEYPTPASLIRYKQEYEITHNLNLDGAIRVYSLEKYQSSLVMILEDFGGESLKILINSIQFSLEDLLKIAISLTNIIGEIHQQNIIHKDINPSNIIFHPNTGKIKIIDFGIATVLTRENPTIKNLNVLEGTLAYMSPEQTGRMNRSMDYRTDFYSLGVTFYELLTSQLPFDAQEAIELVHCHIAKQPVPLHEINPQIPKPVSEIVTKLLAKTAEDRYQSAWGIKADLEECLAQLQSNGQILEFPLGRQDISDKFQIPQKLYGREREVKSLLKAFDRVSQGTTEIMLVSGYSGIGKSALVQEIYKPITRARGYFISGKFDQFQRNIPYSAIVSAFQSLVRQLLTESEVQLKIWKEKLLAAFGPNGQIIIDVIPEVELVIGKQPAVQELGPSESQNRFNLVFLNFIQLFCSKDHPLVIFWDDLQWADPASLKLIDLIIRDDEIQYLLLIGAYRDNEVSPTHPTVITIEELKKEGAIVSQITLTPLSIKHITQLMVESLHNNEISVNPLAELVLRKTGGNPFFVNQFLKTLDRENLLVRNQNSTKWQWNIAEIEAMGITDNVVDLMIGKLKKLPKATQQVLRLAACVGNNFDLTTLSIINEKPAHQIFQAILPAIQESLIVPLSDLEITEVDSIKSTLLILHYKFLHDRVQQAASALIEDDKKRALHLKIGRLLLQNIGANSLGTRIFEVVDHLNLGRELLVDEQEKIELASLNLSAGKKAKDATAYAAALQYLKSGIDCLTGDFWIKHYNLALALHKEQAEVEYLNGNFEQAETLTNLVLSQAKTPLEKAEIYKLLIVQYTLLAKYAEATKAGRKALQILGIDLPEIDLPAAFMAEIASVHNKVGDREISSLINEPKMTSAEQIIASKLLIEMIAVTYFTNQELFAVVVAKIVNFSLTYGHSIDSSHGYSNYAVILCMQGKYQLAYEFGLLALKLCEKFNNLSFKCRDSMLLGNYMSPWNKHFKLSQPIFTEGIKAGLSSGELQFPGYIFAYQNINLFCRGENLTNILAEESKFLQFTHKTKNQWCTDVILAFQLPILNLTGQTREKLNFDHDTIKESDYLSSCQSHGSFQAICYYQIIQSLILYLYGEFTDALKLADSASKQLTLIVGNIPVAEHNFYYSLSLTALYLTASKSEQKKYTKTLVANQKQMKIWADNCPENFLHKYLLVEAEIARIGAKSESAIELYDRAIESARENEFIHNEALGNELAAKFWLAKGKKEFAQLYMTKAHYSYQLWGARRKVEDLEEKYPQLLVKTQTISGVKDSLTHKNKLQSTISSLTSSNSGEALDLATVMKASQAISGEIVLEALLNKLMKMVIENAGAQRSFLILNREGKLLIEADEVAVRQSVPVEDSEQLPLSMINYVARTHENVVLNDAANEPTFATDSYIQLHQPKSVLCAPIINQGKLIGILYLENNLTTSAFTSDRIEVLSILCSQAAISIENALLYNNLEEANEQLEEYSHTLELKVEERTQELKDKNDQLEQTLQQLKAAQKQIIAQEKLASLGSLTAGIAHEISNPLNFVNNFAAVSVDLTQELLEEVENQSEHLESEAVDYIKDVINDLKENVAEINRQGQRAESIVRNMLMHARSESGQRQRADINTIVAEAVQLVYHGKRAKDDSFNIDLEANYDNSIGQVEVVPQDISRAFINIINNACYAVADKKKETGEGFIPTLAVKTLNRSDGVEIHIRDNGKGISQQIQDKIFQPFFTTKPTGEGTGLGLSLTHDIIVGQHQGQIQVESEPGLFAEFIIFLPKTMPIIE